MAHLSISLLGPFQVTLDQQPVTGFQSRKVQALLACLAAESERPHTREALAGLLTTLLEPREVEAIALGQGRAVRVVPGKGKVPELYRIGDCVSPRKVDMAIWEGHKIGREI